MSKRLFLITVDCDLRVDATGLRQETLEQLLAVFDGSGVSGHVTWFLNENDFQLTRYHKSFLDEAIRRGDTLGLHDHLDKMKRPLNKETVKQYCQASKRRVEDFLKKRKVGRKILFHRNGCFLQEATVYAALRELGYTVCSDIYPGMAGLDHHGNIAYDNRLIPEGIRPYRHDEENYSSYFTRIRVAPIREGQGGWKPFVGHFLQVPVGYLSLKINFERVKRWLAISETVEFSCPNQTPGDFPSLFTWCFHPYEIVEEAGKRISREKVNLISQQLEVLHNQYQFTFVSLEQAVKRCEAFLPNQT